MQMSALGGISVNLPWIRFEKRNKWQGWRLNMDRQAGSIKPRWCSQISHSFPLNPNIFSWFFKNILPIEPYVCPTIGASDPSALTEILNTCFFFYKYLSNAVATSTWTQCKVRHRSVACCVRRVNLKTFLFVGFCFIVSLTASSVGVSVYFLFSSEDV